MTSLATSLPVNLEHSTCVREVMRLIPVGDSDLLLSYAPDKLNIPSFLRHMIVTREPKAQTSRSLTWFL